MTQPWRRHPRRASRCRRISSRVNTTSISVGIRHQSGKTDQFREERKHRATLGGLSAYRLGLFRGWLDEPGLQGDSVGEQHLVSLCQGCHLGLDRGEASSLNLDEATIMDDVDYIAINTHFGLTTVPRVPMLDGSVQRLLVVGVD